MKAKYKVSIGCLSVPVILCVIQICYLWGRSYFFMQELYEVNPVFVEYYPMPVSKEQYELDKKYIEECFYNNVDFFRMRDLNPELIPDSLSIYKGRPAGQYYHFTSCVTDEPNSLRTSPISVRKYMKAEVDTIFYSRDAKLCWAFMIITGNDFVYKNVKHYVSYHRTPTPLYSGFCMIGYRENGTLRIYPDERGLFLSDHDHRFTKGKESVMIDLRHFHSKFIKGRPFQTLDGEIENEANVGDSDFFEKAAYFKKFDDSTYYFQIMIDPGDLSVYRHRFPYGN